MNLDPAEFRVVFMRQAGEYWDVPFNWLSFRGQYFTCYRSEATLPLHRIVRIYSMDGTTLFERRYVAERVIVLPGPLEISPGIRIEKHMDVFDIVRMAPTILWQIERLLPQHGEEILRVLGDISEYHDMTYVTEGYFAGTIVADNRVLRGVSPIAFKALAKGLENQRIYVYGKGDVSIIHDVHGRHIIIREGQAEHHEGGSLHQLTERYSVVLLNNKILTLIERDNKIIVGPTRARRILRKLSIPHHTPDTIVKKEWLWYKEATLLITDYDTMLSEKITK